MQYKGILKQLIVEEVNQSKRKWNTTVYLERYNLHTLPSSPLRLTCGLVLQADQYSDKGRQDEEDEDHHGNSHHHPNDNSSLHTTRI